MIGVGALIVNDLGEVLLQYRSSKCKDYPKSWFIPIGKVKPGEWPVEAIIREVSEETSLEVNVIGEIWNDYTNDLIEIAYYCKSISGNPRLMEHDKAVAIGYFPINKLPSGTHEKTISIIEAFLSSKYNVNK